MPERLKGRDWKSRERPKGVPRVRIPLSPPALWKQRASAIRLCTPLRTFPYQARDNTDSILARRSYPSDTNSVFLQQNYVLETDTGPRLRYPARVIVAK